MDLSTGDSFFICIWYSKSGLVFDWKFSKIGQLLEYHIHEPLEQQA